MGKMTMTKTSSNSQRVRRSIARFRKLTLVSVAVIMVINFIMLQRITSVLDHGSATKINDSGRMRMLSQRIRSTAFEINTAVNDGHWDRLEELHTDLTESTNALSRSYNALFGTRAPSEFFPNATTQEIDQVSSIVVPYERLITAAEDLHRLTLSSVRRAPYINNNTKSRITANMDEIRDAQSLFLPRMDTIVSLFEQRSWMEINESTKQARIGLLVLAFLLGAMVLFIIEPTILIVRRQLRELDLATRRERKAASVRWRLLTNMGHEFRTPMNAILGFAELLEDKSLTPPERERLSGSIHESARQLESLIETMLDMSAIESGQLRVTPTPALPSDVLMPCIDRAQTDAIASGLELRTRIDESCNTQIVTEPRRLAQIIDKLIDNAIKFTQQGHIEIRARVRQHNLDDELIVEIEDTGIGINPDQIEHIFDAFHQAQDNLTREFGGSGLGLSFAQDLAHTLNGRIEVISTPGKGSTFTVRLSSPRIPSNTSTQPAPAPESAPTPDTLASARILVVDDSKDNRVLLQHFLKRTGARTDFAYDGQQAIEQVNAAQRENEPYHIILMDMQMPVLDGYNATKQLRESGFTAPIIAITAHALDGDREHCLEAGCDEYLTKPVSRSALLNTCASFISERNKSSETRAAA